jgi:mannosyltransferase
MPSLDISSYIPNLKMSSSRPSSLDFDPQVPSLGPDFVDAPYTASVVYLLTTMPKARPKKSIFRSLSLLQKNFPWRYQWPILLLHAGIYDSEDSQFQFLGRLHNATIDHNMSAEESETLLKRIEFIHVQHDLPAGIPSDRKEYKPI